LVINIQSIHDARSEIHQVIKMDLQDVGWGRARNGLVRHRIGTDDEKRDGQLFGRTLPAGTICMKRFVE